MTEIFDRRGAEIDKVGPRRNAVEQQRKHVIAGGGTTCFSHRGRPAMLS